MTMKRSGMSLRRRLLSTTRARQHNAAAASRDACTAAASAWRALVTPEAGARLLRDGYYVVRGAFPPATTATLRDEMRFLHASGQMYPNATHVLLHGAPQPALLEKHHIFETELALREVRAQVPTLQWLFDSGLVFRALRDATPPWLALSGFMVKLQINEGAGGCFPMHFDSYGGDDGKCITAVLYLNDDWQDGDGGEIVLYPFPREERVVVRPLAGDVVLFASQQMLHRVLPSAKPRYCLTTWLYQAPPNATTKAQAAAHYELHGSKSGDSHMQVLDKIMRSPFRRHLAKLRHRDEWARSLTESHRATPQFTEYVATHEREVGVIDAATTQMLRKFCEKDVQQPSLLPRSSAELLHMLQHDEKWMAYTSRMAIPWF